jgi:hypothetical protein
MNIHLNLKLCKAIGSECSHFALFSTTTSSAQLREPFCLDSIFYMHMSANTHLPQSIATPHDGQHRFGTTDMQQPLEAFGNNYVYSK